MTVPPLTLSINADIFFLIHGNDLVVWDYARHEQFTLSLDHLRAMLDRTFAEAHHELVEELVETNILVPGTIDRPPWGWDLLSRIFHVGTRNPMAEGEAEAADDRARYLEYCADISEKMPEHAFDYHRGTRTCATSEHAGPPDLAPLLRVLERRVTSRTFAPHALPLSELSTLLSATFRYRPHDEVAYKARNLFTPTRRRSSPAGGSLQSCEAYLIALRIDGLERGVYHYWSDADALGFMHALPPSAELGRVLFNQRFANDLAAAVVITCRFDKLWWKYQHSRAYRVALLDCGHLSQTLQLVATAHGLQTWPTGAFFDAELAELVALAPDGPEAPLLVVGIGGKAPPNPFDPADASASSKRPGP